MKIVKKQVDNIRRYPSDLNPTTNSNFSIFYPMNNNMNVKTNVDNI